MNVVCLNWIRLVGNVDKIFVNMIIEILLLILNWVIWLLSYIKKVVFVVKISVINK